MARIRTAIAVVGIAVLVPLGMTPAAAQSSPQAASQVFGATNDADDPPPTPPAPSGESGDGSGTGGNDDGTEVSSENGAGTSGGTGSNSSGTDASDSDEPGADTPDTGSTDADGAGTADASDAEGDGDAEGNAADETPLKRDAAETRAAGTTTIEIQKVGDRTGRGLTAAAGINGAVFEVRASTGGVQGQPTGSVLGTCTTDVAGQCSIDIERNYPNDVWVEEASVPNGWRALGSLGTGDFDSPKTVTPYRFKVEVGTGNRNTVERVTQDRIAPQTEVSNAWVNARNNPDFPGVCGLSIATVFDTSGSINSTEMAQFKAAAKRFVGENALGTTPSSATMFRFDNTASTMNGGVAYDLSTQGSAASNTGWAGAQAQIGTLPNSGGSNAYTNWDDALQLVKSTGDYDVVLFLTDGDPTTYDDGNTRNSNVQFRMVEQAVMSANALKTTLALPAPTQKSCQSASA